MKKEIFIIVAIYLLASLLTYSTWDIHQLYPVTGDEPHYLVMTSGIARYGVLEQTVPYKEEFKTREIFKPGLASAEEIPSPQNTHTVQGPHGIYNAHNIGLPMLLVVPFLLGGVAGAKLFMIFLSGTVMVVVWKIAVVLGADQKMRLLATLSTCVALPLIPASNQIYPDILAGTIALSGLYWFITTGVKRPLWKEGLWICAIAFLPWLQIKFAATCLLLVFALILKIYFESRDFKRICVIFSIFAFSCAILGVYNYYAFGKLTGPYQQGALELSKTAIMVLFGLFIDQNQGFFLQNPILFVGLFAIGALFSWSKPTAALWLLVFLSLIVPNAMHPNWYGGWSFSGRFEWAAAIVFFLPTVFGLLRVGNTKFLHAIIVFSLLLQGLFYCRYSFTDVDLYQRNASAWFCNYSNYYFPAHSWMPAFYNIDWAFSYLPNYAWSITIISLLALGFAIAFRPEKYTSKVVVYTLTFCSILIFASGFVRKKHECNKIFLGKDLPSLTGRIQGGDRVATQGVDALGWVTFGPYFPLRKGSYQVKVRYSSNAVNEQQIGKWDICKTISATNSVQIAEHLLYGTNGKPKVVKAKFLINNWNPESFEFRNYWNGSSEIQIHSIELKCL